MIYAMRFTNVVRKDKVTLDHKAGRFLIKYGLM